MSTVIVGQNLGLGEISTEADIVDAANAGCNGARILSRWLGNELGTGYGEVFQEDSVDDMEWHHVKPGYIAMLENLATISRANGCTIFLGMDSDQLQGRMGGLDLWTYDGLHRRNQMIRLARMYARRLKPDYIEPIVEPQGPNVTTAGLQAYQYEFMTRVHEANPALKFLLGGAPSYQAAYIDRVYDPDWSGLGFDISLTCNFQGDLVCNPQMFMDRLGIVLRARDRWGVPVIVNQIWSEAYRDPDGMLLANAIRALKAEGIGSLVWTACVRYEGNAGLRYLADWRDPNSEHLFYTERWANVTAAWQE